MTRLRCAASVFTFALVLLGPACRPSRVALGFDHIKEPPGFGRSTPFYREDAAGGQIIVDVAVGDKAQVVDRSQAPTGGDVALAWISNTSPGDERVYHFKPNKAATYILYWNGAGTFRIEEDLVSGQKNPNWKTGSFTVCDSHNAGIPDVGFKDCNKGGNGGTPSSTPAAMKTSSIDGGLFNALYARILALLDRPFAPPAPDSPGWTACTDGCCSWSAT